jgi:hypothetical protein
MKTSITISPRALGGFFSNCSKILQRVIAYFNRNKAIPDVVDCSRLFKWYKPRGKGHLDILNDYFEKRDELEVEYTKDVHYSIWDQFGEYKNIDYEFITPFMKKYFSPSMEIKNIISDMEVKYKLDYENTCVLLYRGNDKVRETSLCEYDEMVEQANIIKTKNPDIRFLIQSDETEFLDEMKSTFQGSFCFYDEIRHTPRQRNGDDHVMAKVFPDDAYEFAKYYLAITFIMSKCKHVIFNSSGNCSMWVALYRGNVDGVVQYLDGKFV